MKTISKKALSTAVATVLMGVSALPVHSAAIQKVISASSEITNSAASSQQKIDKIAEQVQEKLMQFRAMEKETAGLDIYNGQIQKQINSQIEEMEQLNKDIDQVSVIERQITPLMLRMIDGLESFVALDVPFLPTERQERLTSLKTMMDKADIAVSEKFRRVMEAYQVEVDYGRSIEAYSGLLELDGQERDVDFLRIGRVALMYLSRDGSLIGRWDNEQKSFQALSPDYRMHITKGLRMAKKQLAPDLLTLPIPAPVLVSANTGL
ncbi:DUF3450 domain-containing protein [Psychrosphaera sp. F3M07]|jgi:hypothetical protein|uniref:DUF3450 domain-containing protein n=1 Tax=Psychrosphaera aquimarina TaxID=2044854 RepID=A0ABU3QZM8_9GAMM|nr:MULTISPECIES: DUF3450 domain-containing protein [Psychrosphaera]MBU2917531.1 DUF3450 domain-containing protein [Psychrosphaera sp. F3M07]MDU0112878.1 DUF3450 domain-containing protein [Psychrosphaera aquimarina]